MFSISRILRAPQDEIESTSGLAAARFENAPATAVESTEQLFKEKVFEIAKSVKTFFFPSSAVLLDSGNLLVRNEASKVIRENLDPQSDWRQVKEKLAPHYNDGYHVAIQGPKEGQDFDVIKKSYAAIVAAVVALEVESGRLKLNLGFADFLKSPLTSLELRNKKSLAKYAAEIILEHVLPVDVNKGVDPKISQLICDKFNWHEGIEQRGEPNAAFSQLTILASYFQRMSKITSALESLSGNKEKLNVPPLVIQFSKDLDVGLFGLKGYRLIVPRLLEVTGVHKKAAEGDLLDLQHLRSAFPLSSDMSIFLNIANRLSGPVVQPDQEDPEFKILPYESVDQARKVALNAAKHALTSSFEESHQPGSVCLYSGF